MVELIAAATDIGGALCRVELAVTPTIHVGGDPGDEEEDRLDNAYGLTPQSRLACVCVPDGSRDVVVEVPAWNRNRVRESK